MKTFSELRENLAPKSLIRTNITARNVSDQKRNIGKLGYKTSTKPVGGQEEGSGFQFRQKKIQDPYAQERKLRDINRGINKQRRLTGFKSQ